MVTFAQLRELNSEMFRKAASGYGRLATVAGTGTDDVDLGRRDIAGWEGDAGAAAGEKAGKLITASEQHRERLSQLDRALADHASRMEQQQRKLADVVIAITSSHGSQLSLDFKTGAITPLVDETDLTDAGWSTAQHNKQLAQEYADQITKILNDTATIDGDTARKIDSIIAAVAGGRPPNASQLLGSVPPRGSNPKQVRDWWNSLSPEERAFLIREAPDQIGWLDGIPATDRDEANRLMLQSSAEGIEDRMKQLQAKGNLTPQEQQELERLRKHMEGINAIRARMAASGPGQERLFLLGFDTKGEGHAIVAIGNPDTADNVVTYVPGTGSSMDGCRGDITRADRTATDANTFDPSRRTAAIMWIGYDAPQNIVPQAMQPEWAQSAEHDLSRFQDGLRVTHDGPRSHNTVVGHSYGSTVVGFTARDVGLDADDVVFVGSPGAGVDNAGGLRGADGQPVPPGHVWSSHAKNDPIQYASYSEPWPFDKHGNIVPREHLVHGRNPTEPEFGAHTFTSDPGDPLKTMHAHSQYWDPYSSSQRNMTYIITGRYGAVS